MVAIPQTFTISYTHRNFASLKPKKAVAKKETFDPTVLWNYVGGEKLVDREIEDLSAEKADDHIDGTIRLLLDSLEMTGVEVGNDFEYMIYIVTWNNFEEYLALLEQELQEISRV